MDNLNATQWIPEFLQHLRESLTLHNIKNYVDMIESEDLSNGTMPTPHIEPPVSSIPTLGTIDHVY